MPALSGLRGLVRRALGRDRASGATARRRLQLVLVQDRLSLTTDRMEALKNDLIEVISRYLVIERESIEVEVRRSGDSVILVSNIRISEAQRPADEHAPARAEAD